MPIRILLVEDNPGDAVIFREKLNASDLDYTLAHAKRLSEGLKQLRDEAFDILMVDLSLPDAQGMEAVDQMREAAPRCPLIVLTGLDDATAAAEAKQRGAVDYLVKWYVDSVSLARYVRYAIAQYKMEESGQSRPKERAAEPARKTAAVLEVEGMLYETDDVEEEAEANDDADDPLRRALEGSDSAVLVVTNGGDVAFANSAARRWVEGASYPWPLADGERRVPRKGQALVQRAGSTQWSGEAAWFVTLSPAPPEQSAQPAIPSPKADVRDEVTSTPASTGAARPAAEAALRFIEHSQRQSTWLSDVLRMALDLERGPDLQPDLVDILEILNQTVREQRDLAMARGLPVRVASERKKVVAFADRNVVSRIAQRLVVDAIHDARHDGVRLRAEVLGDVSILEAKWHSLGSNDEGATSLGRQLIEQFVQHARGTMTFETDATGEHSLTVRLPGRPE